MIDQIGETVTMMSDDNEAGRAAENMADKVIFVYETKPSFVRDNSHTCMKLLTLLQALHVSSRVGYIEHGYFI